MKHQQMRTTIATKTLKPTNHTTDTETQQHYYNNVKQKNERTIQWDNF